MMRLLQTRCPYQEQPFQILIPLTFFPLKRTKQLSILGIPTSYHMIFIGTLQMDMNSTITLNSGYKIPVLGLGLDYGCFVT